MKVYAAAASYSFSASFSSVLAFLVSLSSSVSALRLGASEDFFLGVESRSMT